MSLCLLVTRRCDLRCGFCPLEFEDRDMTWDVASSAVEEHLARGLEPKVKFFGGEPVLNWDLIVRVVEAGRGAWAGRGLRFELATNGTGLDAERLAYLRSRPEVEVTLSRPVSGGAALPGVWFTMVLTPSCRPSTVVRGLRELVREGYRRFNFLPAYYQIWTEPQLRRLRLSFSAALRALEAMRSAGLSIEVRNEEVSAPVPLYNDVATVDVDGEVYASNLIRAKGMERFRDRLRIGSVGRDDFQWREPANRAAVLDQVLGEWLPPDVLSSTRRVDEALTGFVEALVARA